MRQHQKILVVVKTYPHPSDKYREIVCTAGFTEQGEFLRLYPFAFRTFGDEKFSKYQWISVDIEKSIKDPRPESYKAFPDTLKLHETLPPWKCRVPIVLNRELPTMCDLKNNKRDETSLAVIKPRVITDFKMIRCGGEWKAKEKSALMNGWLFDADRRPLKKLPYRFVFHYKCMHKNCQGHKQSIFDWEVGTLFLNMCKKYDEKIALEKVKNKFFNEICSEKNDVHFFVGTHSKYLVWLILGLFYPPKKFSKVKNDQNTLWSV